MSMRRWVVLAVLASVGAGSGGCDAADRPVPHSAVSPLTNVMQIDPCIILPEWTVEELHLGGGTAEGAGYRRACHYPAGDGVVALDLVLRVSTGANIVADAGRLAEAARLQEHAVVDALLIGDRPVFRVFGLRPTAAWPWRRDLDEPVCSLLFGIDRTASFEAALTLPAGTRDCPPGSLADDLAAILPPPAAGAGPPPSGGPETSTAVDPCTLVAPAQRTRLALLTGRPRVDGCLFDTSDGREEGTLAFVSISVYREIGAQDIGDEYGPAILRTVTDRPVYERTHVDEQPSGTVYGLCSYAFEVSRSMGVQASVYVYGRVTGPACRVLADLAPTIESGLPPATA